MADNVRWRGMEGLLCPSRGFAQLFGERGDLVEKSSHQQGVKLDPGSVFQLLNRLFERERIAIRPVCGERIKNVRDCNNAREEGNIVALQAVRISAPVTAFVVV